MIRPAETRDVDAVRGLVQEAYGPYVARIGKPPGPMSDDYDRRIASNQAWVCDEGGEVVGLIVLEEGPDGILLDNMAPATLREAVEMNAGRAKLEASGGITLENVRAVAETGVGLISIGALTHSAPALDLSLTCTPTST